MNVFYELLQPTSLRISKQTSSKLAIVFHGITALGYCFYDISTKGSNYMYKDKTKLSSE